MKKKLVLIVFLFVIMSLFGVPKIEAGVVCTKKKLSELRNKAYAVSLSYELHKNPDGSHYYSVIITNLSKDLVAHADGSVIKGGDPSEKHIIERHYIDQYTLEVEIYAGYGIPCEGQKLYTKRIVLPRYNVYSERDECIEYEEFPLCNPWYKGKINGDYQFEVELNEYIKKLNPEKKKEVEKEKTTFEKIIDYYMEHAIFTIPVTIIVVGSIVAIIVNKTKKRRNRIKLDI